MRFYEKKFAVEYNNRLSEEGYPGILLEKIINQLKGLKTVIDVGAGTGFFSIPLAEMGYRVTAIEPSVEMLKLLRSKLKGGFSENLTIVHSGWETWHGSKNDGLICIHSIYPMKDPASAILKMLDYAEKRIMLIKKTGPGTLTDLIKNHFKFKKDKFDYISFAKDILAEHKVAYSIQEIFQERVSQFNDIEEKAEYYLYYLKLDRSKKNEMKDFLEHVTEKENNAYYFKSTYHDYMFIF